MPTAELSHQDQVSTLLTGTDCSEQLSGSNVFTAGHVMVAVEVTSDSRYIVTLTEQVHTRTIAHVIHKRCRVRFKCG